MYKIRNAYYGRRPFFKSRSKSRRFGRRARGENIDVSRFIQKPSFSLIEGAIKIKNTFFDFNLCDPIKNNLKFKNYLTPTPIQDQAIGHILAGRDLVGIADTGTGKTAAFLLPLIEKVFKDKSQNVLIVAPTRELALQIENEFHQFSYAMKIFSAVCIGKAPIYRQISHLRRKPNFVIGTPGRLKDLNERRELNFSSFQNIVIDEFDRMLDMGFIDDIKEMLNQLPINRQSLFFSATMPSKISALVGQFSRNPIRIEIKAHESAKNVEQDIIRVRERGRKFDQLQELLIREGMNKVLVFVETKMEVERVTSGLIKYGFKADSMHGDKRQSQRIRALSQFKNNAINILVATDVAARGLDIKDVSHVINYTVPQSYNDYIHRIGRTGRAGKKGHAFTFVE